MKKPSTTKEKWALIRELSKFRKPMPPPTRVHIPKKEYDRKDKSWRNEVEN